MKRYLSASLKIRERRHPAEHANVWLGLATLWLIPLALGQAAQPATPSGQVLWYDQSAGNWESEALPIGNGRLGAMIFGVSEKETVQLNEDSLWLGDENDTGMYQNLGECEVALPRAKPVENYRRELDISRAVHTVSYTSDGVMFRREAFASLPDQVMVFRFTSDKPGSHSGSITFKDGHDVKPVIGPNMITTAGKLVNGLQFESQIRVINDGGTLTATPTGIAFENVNSLTLMVGAGTDYLNQRAKGWRTGEAPHRLVTEQIDKAATSSVCARCAPSRRRPSSNPSAAGPCRPKMASSAARVGSGTRLAAPGIASICGSTMPSAVTMPISRPWLTR
ncbi:MAG: glycoside hydrolase N-terminal domain-containing protein [Verrucomicrobia bacterium]|nr:glycoside hydrolase N-terminal domain-containing protein [Verrucomicrobiota bacterium]